MLVEDFRKSGSSNSTGRSADYAFAFDSVRHRVDMFTQLALRELYGCAPSFLEFLYQGAHEALLLW